MNVTFLSESTEKEARTSASVLLFGGAGALTGGATAPLGTTGGCIRAGAFFTRNSSAHDLCAAGFGGDDLGVSSALPSFSGIVPDACSD